MIDFHCHLLPGVDDGSENIEESLQMGMALVRAGFTEVCCTPHCLHGVYENTPQLVRKATDDLQQVFNNEGIRLKLHPGMEYYLDEMFLSKLEDLQPLGSSRLVLVEAPLQACPEILKNTLFQIVRRKWVPVMAHPERCSLFDRPLKGGGRYVGTLLRKIWPFNKRHMPGDEETVLQSLVNMGCRFQGNIPSFSGWYGPGVAKQAHAHQVAGTYTYYGSDGHDAKALKHVLGPGLDKISELQGQPVTQFP